MERLQSSLQHNYNLPYKNILHETLFKIDWVKYIPYNFIADSLVITKDILLHNKTKNPSDYYVTIFNLFNGLKITNWMLDTLKILKDISKIKSLRVIDEFSVNKTKFQLNEIPKSFNYIFDITKININIKTLLQITEEQENEIETLDSEIVNLLTITSAYGEMLRTSKVITTQNKQMKSYSDINRLSKANLASPFFMYKFALKLYTVSYETVDVTFGGKLVLGYFLSSNVGETSIQLILKLLGVLLLLHDVPQILIYAFYGNSHIKTILNTPEEVIDYFSTPKQLMLYPINNNTALQTLIIENKGNEIIFLPNTKEDCTLLPAQTGLCKINILSYNSSKFNLKYSTICKRTNGLFLTI